MGCTYKILRGEDLETVVPSNQKFALDVLIGLSEKPKQLSSMYFYDDTGSRLFQKIMALPEYYLTSCEMEIIKTQTEQFSNLVGDGTFHLIELGAGDGSKTSVLIDHFLQKKLEFDYIPIDISEAAMKTLLRSMGKKFETLSANGLVAEYFDGLKWISQSKHKRNMVLMLGSNLGNFNKARARVFLRSLWNSLNNGDYVVIGFDLKKDIEIMLRAYNDSQGVTEKFNLNLLRRINTELGGQFDLNKFRFYANYNVFSGAIESFLVSLEPQRIYIAQLGDYFEFDAWEPIHTEYSYKFLESDISLLAEQTGYRIVHQLYDSKRYFVDSIWRVEKLEATAHK
ncbi:MAG: L-histidine N(alpha)-methyltransferase [Calditrichaeota bacterium]|nr:MAG: L-histidine N(alpha)-methyltransferase [Calditrichota bacterium]